MSQGSTSRRTGSGSSKLHGTPSRTRTPPPPQLRPIPDFGPILQSSSSNPTLQVTSPTPVTPVAQQNRRTHLKSSPAEPPSSVLRHASPPPVQKSHSSGSAGGKRKADQVEGGTPPKDAQKEQQRATFAPLEPRPHRASAGTNSSYAPSSFHRQKRARLSTTPESRPPSRSGSTTPQTGDSPNSKRDGTWSSKASAQRAASQHGSYAPSTGSHQPHRAPSRRSLSQASIPISALVSPHAPSVTTSGRYHMRDPRKPTPIQGTPWSLSFPERVERGLSRWAFHGWVERGGSPLHAWLFFFGFIIFPLWWAAALFIPIPRTRRLGADEAEKGVILDDPQVEHDAKSWRTRCRVMAVVSFFTYIPFIVLVAIFAKR
ncbi:hypothetical protein BDQ17DRAFT_1240006 [Cyathus striatus]|nr:hypothetical protein BDQ17DRAFT_1240006 [Cyathus striatus]